MTKPALLYIHIPFCIHHCRYCSACVLTGDSAAKLDYLAALEAEITASASALSEYCFSAVYIGGGSPTTMNPDGIAKLLRLIKRELPVEARAEITVEAMPQTICTPSLGGLKAGGANRISLSMQSVNQEELNELDCGFSYQDVENAMLFLDRFRFNNVNIDLMYGIPGQTKDSFKKTLRAARAFDPRHVSVYPFCGEDGQGLTASVRNEDQNEGIVSQDGRKDDTAYIDNQDGMKINQVNKASADINQEGTHGDEVISENRANCEVNRLINSECDTPLNIPSNEELLAFAADRLEAYGYERYSAYHFVKKGHSQSTYWRSRYEGMEYVGLGLGARSLIDGFTYANTTDWETYLEHSSDFARIVTSVAELSEEHMEHYVAASQKLLRSSIAV